MTDFFAGGHVATLLLAILGLEAALLLALWRWRGQGVPPAPLLAFLASGAFLALALHAALSGCSSGVVVCNIDNGYGAACAALRILRISDVGSISAPAASSE